MGECFLSDQPNKLKENIPKSDVTFTEFEQNRYSNHIIYSTSLLTFVLAHTTLTMTSRAGQNPQAHFPTVQTSGPTNIALYYI
jgi:hypothetical protein